MKKSIAIFGGGPASLALASFLDPDVFQVTIYEQNKTCGRKFLVAGKGGFNLTHSEPLDDLIKRYMPASFLEDALRHFSNINFRDWLASIGIETFVGSSKRVFPMKRIKPIEVLQAILNQIESNGVVIRYQSKWNGRSANGLPIINDEEVKADYCVFAFGGASWKKTGSTGKWTTHFESRGISVNAFEPSNCAYKVEWPTNLIESIEGKPLKNIALTSGGKTQKGELVITQFGMEGNAIYALSGNIRKQLHSKNKAKAYLDMKPMLTIEDLEIKSGKSKAKNTTEFLKQDLNLSKVQVQLIKGLTSKEDFVDRSRLIEIIKGFPIVIEGVAPIEEAISTVGGIKKEELTSYFELRIEERSFCIGEMVDWDAPTGGYLLQGCFSMGVYLADRLNELQKD